MAPGHLHLKLGSALRAVLAKNVERDPEVIAGMVLNEWTAITAFEPNQSMKDRLVTVLSTLQHIHKLESKFMKRANTALQIAKMPQGVSSGLSQYTNFCALEVLEEDIFDFDSGDAFPHDSDADSISSDDEIRSNHEIESDESDLSSEDSDSESCDEIRDSDSENDEYLTEKNVSKIQKRV